MRRRGCPPTQTDAIPGAAGAGALTRASTAGSVTPRTRRWLSTSTEPVPGRGLDNVADQRPGSVESLVAGRLLGHIAEQVPQPGMREANLVPVRGKPEQDLSDRQAQQFGVRQFRRPPNPATRRHMVVDEHIQCRQKGVQICLHTLANDGRPSPWSRPAQEIGLTRLARNSCHYVRCESGRPARLLTGRTVLT